MTRFMGIEKMAGRTIAILEDFEMLKADKPSLLIRIRNLKRSGADTTEEERALRALNEVCDNGNV